MNGRWRVNADDFGWTDGQNQAVEKAYQLGVLTHASLLTTTPGFAGAVEIARQNPGLQVGVHLALNEVPPALPSDKLQGLLQPDGRFPDSLGTLLRAWFGGRLAPAVVLAEWQQQIERALAAGLTPTHLDGHKHVHMLPPLLDAAIHLAKAYQIPYVRLPLEGFSTQALRRGPAWGVLWGLAQRARPHLQRAGLQFAAHFHGIAFSGQMTWPHLHRALAAHPPGQAEIMVHPAVRTPSVRALQTRYRWAAQYRFEEELDALLHAKTMFNG